MNVLIGLIPALTWGILPLVVTKIGGKSINQILGTTFGTLIASIIVWFFVRPEITTAQFLNTILSGAFWGIGQYLQYMAFKRIGVSKAMPISTGLQLVGTSILGVFAFGEWSATMDLLLGFSALILIIVGIIFTTIQGTETQDSSAKKLSPWIITLIFTVSTLGYIGYSALPRIANVSGWQGFLPQALGMATISVIISLVTSNANALKEKVTWINLISGFIFSIAALTYLISAQKNGVATGFTLSQMNVVIATLGGIFILKEKKSHKGFAWTITGLVLVTIGGIMIGSMA